MSDERERISIFIVQLALLVVVAGLAFMAFAMLAWASYAVLQLDTSWTRWPDTDWPWFARVFFGSLVVAAWLLIAAGARAVYEWWSE